MACDTYIWLAFFALYVRVRDATHLEVICVLGTML